VPLVLSLTEAAGGILVPQSLDMLLEEGHPHTLLDDGLDGVPLHVEHVLRVLGHHNHTSMKVRTLWVGYVLKTLPPHGLLLLADWEQRGVVEAALTHGSEGDVCYLLDRLVQLDADDSRSPQLC
jgi:hypothetical protein